MMADIFSVFDDHNSVFMSSYMLMWLFIFTVLLLFSAMYWVREDRWSNTKNLPKSVISSQVSCSFGKDLGGFLIVLSALFILLIIFNLLGLVPYVFSNTSHLAVTFSLGFPLWFSLILTGSFLSPTSTAAALLPAGAPAPLNPFLVLVETVSLCVRPITLSVRLAANMSSGHIVLGLISDYLVSAMTSSSCPAAVSLYMLEWLYFIFEYGVSLIQAYIFCLLITLYSDDHPSL
uniref:ATP synthase subunit a n=1 Tax=Titiscania limacina TaxID=200181 RepID=A0A1B2G3H7_9GAST|nr:ATP synthase F0 subunit 6 [Titiscania limacina]